MAALATRNIARAERLGYEVDITDAGDREECAYLFDEPDRPLSPTILPDWEVSDGIQVHHLRSLSSAVLQRTLVTSLSRLQATISPRCPAFPSTASAQTHVSTEAPSTSFPTPPSRLTVFLEAVTSQRAGVIYTFVGMVATLVLGIGAWKLAIKSFRLSALASNQAQRSTVGENSPRRPGSPAKALTPPKPKSFHLVRSLLRSTLKPPSACTVVVAPHIHSFKIDMLTVIVTLALCFTLLIYTHIFLRQSHGTTRQIVHFLTYLISTPLGHRLKADAPRLAGLLGVMSGFVFLPLAWKLVDVALSRRGEWVGKWVWLRRVTWGHRIGVAVSRAGCAWVLGGCVVRWLGMGTDGGRSGFEEAAMIVKIFMVVCLSEAGLGRGEVAKLLGGWEGEENVGEAV